MATDVTRDPNYPPSFVYIRLCWSKSNPFNTGVHVYLGWTSHPICPVAALLAFLAVHPANQKRPLFRFRYVAALCRDRPMQKACTVLLDQGFDHSKYHGHSFWDWGSHLSSSRGNTRTCNQNAQSLGLLRLFTLGPYPSSPVSWVFHCTSPFTYPTT